MLPPEERDVITRLFLDAELVLEFGSGGSTIFCVENSVPIISVESDRLFHTALSDFIKTKPAGDLAVLVQADIGRTGRYGMPLFRYMRSNLSRQGLRYVLSGYLSVDQTIPDVIFVDGRWRVACALFCLVLGWRESLVVIDDYELDRGYPDTIEKFFDVEVTGRLAMCRPKAKINSCDLRKSVEESFADPS
jgi:hypothetical protein